MPLSRSTNSYEANNVDQLAKQAFRIFKIAGTHNIADVLTKYVPKPLMDRMLALMGCRYETDELATAVKLAA